MAYFSQLLALFLILLCFFIMLVSLSQQQSRPGGAAVAATTNEADAGPAPLSQGAVALLADLRSRLAPQIGEAFEVGLGNGPVLTVMVPAQRFFERSASRLAPSGSGLIEALAQSLAVETEARVFELEAVFSTPARSSQTLVTARAGTLARELVRLGAPPGRIAVGIEEGAAERLRLSFYMRDLAAAGNGGRQ